MDIIPYDKYWLFGLGILDMLHDYDDIYSFLELNTNNLTTDLYDFKLTFLDWYSNKSIIYIGQSYALFNIILFIITKLKVKKPLYYNNTIIDGDSVLPYCNYTQQQLLDINIYWCIALILLGDPVRLSNPPIKIDIIYQSYQHWKEKRSIGEYWIERNNIYIQNLFDYFLQLYHNPIDIDINIELPKMLKIINYNQDYQDTTKIQLLVQQYNNGIIDIKDSKLIECVVLISILCKKKITIKYPELVKKNWNKFWIYFTRFI